MQDVHNINTIYIVNILLLYTTCVLLLCGAWTQWPTRIQKVLCSNLPENFLGYDFTLSLSLSALPNHITRQCLYTAQLSGLFLFPQFFHSKRGVWCYWTVHI